MTRTFIRSVARSIRNSLHAPHIPPAACEPEPEKRIVPANAYETLYENHAKYFKGDVSVGEGDYEKIGRVELDLLLMEGLKPGDTLLDFGCGNGRLAVHVVPQLNGHGRFIGIDISPTYLEQGAERIDRTAPDRACQVEWIHQNTPNFPLPDDSVDMMCAFSVFTHMENEDSYHYLKDALRIVRPGGKFIFSCLPLDLKYARRIFLEEAAMSLEARWQRIRNVITSKELMTQLAELAGWKVLKWYEGEEDNIGLGDGPKNRLGQSSCIAVAP